MSAELTIIPRITEKTHAASQGNVYVFKVPMSANKQQIAAAVATQYGVTVQTVNVAITKGKRVRSARKRSMPITGQRVDSKKAYVRLKDGDSIKMFEEAEK